MPERPVQVQESCSEFRPWDSDHTALAMRPCPICARPLGDDEDIPEVVPRSVADDLAEALDSLGAEYIGRPDAVLYPARFRNADRVLREYRSRHPKAS